MKIKTRTNFRLQLQPTDFLISELSEEQIYDRYMIACRKLMENINRHVDGIDSIHILYDTEERCSHCGMMWEEDNGVPQCCQEAIDELKIDGQVTKLSDVTTIFGNSNTAISVAGANSSITFLEKCQKCEGKGCKECNGTGHPNTHFCK